MFGTNKKQQKQDQQTAKSVDAYLARIDTLLDNYRRLNRRSEKAVHEAEKNKNKKHTENFAELVKEAETLKATYLRYKQCCKDDIDRIADDSIKQQKRDALRPLQDRYKNAREEYKAIGVEDYVQDSEREELFKEARQNADPNVSRPNQSKNENLLNKADTTAKHTTQQLREGLHDVNQAQATAEEVAVTLHKDRETIQKISQNVDEIESDLQISQKLLTRFIKRLYTDKIVICFTCLIVCALAGIIAYSVLEGGDLGGSADEPS